MFAALIALLATPAALSATPSPTSDAELQASSLFRELEGEWTCAGAFANGSPLKAKLQFIPALGGHGLRLIHRDLPPTTYAAEALWGMDKASGRLFSMSWQGSTAKPDENAAVYISEELSSTSVIFDQRGLLAPPFAPNRFRWTIRGDSLTMEWEVERQNVWKEGDHLTCTRQRR